jgi:hypothetical protein
METAKKKACSQQREVRDRDREQSVGFYRDRQERAAESKAKNRDWTGDLVRQGQRPRRDGGDDAVHCIPREKPPKIARRGRN